MLPTQRLSPKNQVTIPREARALAEKTDASHLRGLLHGIPKAGTGEIFRVVLLMTEAELKRREERILADEKLTGEQKVQLVTEMNGGAALMAVDGQRRIVLPAHFVAYLGLERDVFLNSTNTTIQVWNPEHFQQWTGRDGGTVYNPALNTYLMI